MNSNWFVRVAALLVLLAVAAGSLLQAQQDEPVPADQKNQIAPDQVADWVAQLNSDRYVERELATEKLIEAGLPSVRQVREVLRGSNLEVTTRGVYVLRELALSGDLETEEAAREALESVAQPEATTLARKAAATLAVLDRVRQDRAVETLQQLGAKIHTPGGQIGLLTTPGVLTLELGDDWHGEEKDLRRLKWLVNVHQVVLEGPQITDGVMPYVAEMKDLAYLSIKRAKISDAGIAQVKKLEKVQRIYVMYTPVSDAAVDHLAALDSATDIRIYGTKITPMGRDRLEKALAMTKIDYRRGAFLGVSCDLAGQNGCLVRYVHPGSAADKAGLQPGDLIVKYEGKNVADIEGHTTLISENNVGDTVALEINRNGETTTKKVTFGEWE